MRRNIDPAYAITRRGRPRALIALALAALFVLPTVLAQAPVYSGDAGSGRDAGDTRETAVRIGPGVHSGSFEKREDVLDTYLFAAPAGALIQLDLRSPGAAGEATVNLAGHAPRMSLEAPDGRVNERALGAALSFIAWEGGDWMLQLHKSTGVIYGLELGITAFPLQDDAGTGGDAVPLWTSPARTSERLIEGRVGGADDSDAYVTQLEAGDWSISLDTEAGHNVELLVEIKGRLVPVRMRESTLRVEAASDLQFAVSTTGEAGDYAIRLEQVPDMLPEGAFHVVNVRVDPDAMIPAGDGKSVYASNYSHILRVDEDGAHVHVDAKLHTLAGLDVSGRVLGLDNYQALRVYDSSAVVPLYGHDSGFIRDMEFGSDGGGVALAFNYSKPILLSLHPDGTSSSVPLALTPWNIWDLAFAPDGTLYASTFDGIRRVDPATGEMHLVAPLAAGGPLAFDADGLAYVVAGWPTPVLMRIDLERNESTPVAFAPGRAYALAFSGERLWFSGQSQVCCSGLVLGFFETGVAGFEGFRSQLTPPALAELAVTSVRVEPRELLSPDQPEPGREHWRILVDVANVGEADVVEPFAVQVDARGSPPVLGAGGHLVGESWWQRSIDQLPAGATTTLEIEWDVTARAGNFTVMAVADPWWRSTVLEAEEVENNRNSHQVFVRANSDPVIDVLRAVL